MLNVCVRIVMTCGLLHPPRHAKGYLAHHTSHIGLRGSRRYLSTVIAVYENVACCAVKSSNKLDEGVLVNI